MRTLLEDTEHQRRFQPVRQPDDCLAKCGVPVGAIGFGVGYSAGIDDVARSPAVLRRFIEGNHRGSAAPLARRITAIVERGFVAEVAKDELEQGLLVALHQRVERVVIAFYDGLDQRPIAVANRVARAVMAIFHGDGAGTFDRIEREDGNAKCGVHGITLGSEVGRRVTKQKR